MKNERLARILGLIDEDIIAESDERKAKRKVHWLRWTSLAACLCIVALGAWVLGGGLRMGASAPENVAPNELTGERVNGVEDSAAYMSYAGPVFPLTLSEASDAVTAARDITLDFASYTTKEFGHKLSVTDSCVLSNRSAEDLTVTAIYPVAGSLHHLQEVLPEILVDGAAVETALHFGAYAGGFVLGDNMNLDQANSWEDYKALLSDGSYLTQTYAALPELTEPVIVYDVRNGAAPVGYDAATMALRFEYDEAQTEILSFDFNGGETGEGYRRYSYFIDEWQKNSAMLIVRGADIGEYTTQAYENGVCRPGEELDIACTVTRKEMTLGKAIAEAANRYCAKLEIMYAADENVTVPTAEQLYRATVELLLQYGTEAEKTMGRYEFGRLDDLLADAQVQTRLLYNSFEVHIPAGGSVTVTARMQKAPSFDFHCGAPENAGLEGYDLATALGSDLRFTSQTATIETRDVVEIVRQNFGFDPENGVTTVELDPSVEHYWLEVRQQQNQ